MAHELGTNQLGAADEVDAEPEIARRREGAIDGSAGRMIAAHGVNRNAHGVIAGSVYSSLTGRTWRAR